MILPLKAVRGYKEYQVKICYLELIHFFLTTSPVDQINIISFCQVISQIFQNQMLDAIWGMEKGL
jgi:hypothetical protein